MNVTMIRRSLPILLMAGAALGAAARQQGGAADQVRNSIAGSVVTTDGGPAQGALVTARALNSTVSHTVITGSDGTFRLDGLSPGEHEVTVQGPAWTAEAPIAVRVPGEGSTTFSVARTSVARERVPSSSLLGMLPAGEEKRRFVRDCTGCHVLDARIAFPGGSARSESDWAEWTRRMLDFAGPQSGFPVIGVRSPEQTAAYLVRHLTDAAVPASPATAEAHAAGAVITEYLLPAAGDLPHDVAVLEDARVLITGMFTHRMYLLDPQTGEITTEAIPQGNANPRAVEIGEDGSWWVVLGGPQRIARRTPAGEWTSWHVGVYAHSLAIAPDGRVWYNGHFTRNPEVLGVVDAASPEVTRFEVPAHPEAVIGAGPIPYELRAATDGRIWGTELVGNRVYAYDPATARFEVWTMPETHSGPRRLDIGPDGMVWIPEYSGGQLSRLDPRTGEFRRFPLPIEDAAPYIARVDARTGRVWLGTGAADAIFAFDPATERWTTYPLPSRAALVRHLAVDPRNGDLWIAYGASPGPPAKVARLRVAP